MKNDRDFGWFADAQALLEARKKKMTPGTEEFRVFAGGYSREEFAQVMQRLHEDKGPDFENRKQVLGEKAIHDGAYFVVGYSRDEPDEDIPATGLFIAGYRPYSDYPKFNVKRRGYGRLVVMPDEKVLLEHFSKLQTDEILRVAEKKFVDDKRLNKAQVYLMKDMFRYDFQLEMENGDWFDIGKINALVERLARRCRLMVYSEPEMFTYCSRESKGYFLENREYVVWHVIIGTPTSGGDLGLYPTVDPCPTAPSYTKMALLIDALSGSVSIIPFERSNRIDYTPVNYGCGFNIIQKAKKS